MNLNINRLLFTLALLLSLLFSLTGSYPAFGQDVATEGTERNPVNPVNPVPSAPVAIFCYLCDERIIRDLLPAGFTLPSGQELLWSFDKPGKGTLILLLPDRSTCPAKVTVIWRSKSGTAKRAMREFLFWQQGGK